MDMQQNNQTDQNLNPNQEPNNGGTDPEKVKREIQQDISRGQGAMTSREAGGMWKKGKKN